MTTKFNRTLSMNCETLEAREMMAADMGVGIPIDPTPSFAGSAPTVEVAPEINRECRIEGIEDYVPGTTVGTDLNGLQGNFESDKGIKNDKHPSKQPINPDKHTNQAILRVKYFSGADVGGPTTANAMTQGPQSVAGSHGVGTSSNNANNVTPEIKPYAGWDSGDLKTNHATLRVKSFAGSDVGANTHGTQSFGGSDVGGPSSSNATLGVGSFGGSDQGASNETSIRDKYFAGMDPNDLTVNSGTTIGTPSTSRS